MTISYLGQGLVQDSLTRCCRSRVEGGIATPSLVPTDDEVRASTWMDNNAIKRVNRGYTVLDGTKGSCCCVFFSLYQKKAFGYNYRSVLFE